MGRPNFLAKSSGEAFARSLTFLMSNFLSCNAFFSSIPSISTSSILNVAEVSAGGVGGSTGFGAISCIGIPVGDKGEVAGSLCLSKLSLRWASFI